MGGHDEAIYLIYQRPICREADARRVLRKTLQIKQTLIIPKPVYPAFLWLMNTHLPLNLKFGSVAGFLGMLPTFQAVR